VSPSKDGKRIRKILRHPKRKLIWGVVLLGIAVLVASRSSSESTITTFFVLLFIGAVLLFSHLRDRRFIKRQPEADVSAEKASIKNENELDKRKGHASKQIKSELKNGNEVWGRVLVTSTFGFGTIRIYANGYIFSTTRMKSPEKLLAISSNTSLMNSNPYHEQVMGGAMLSVQTDSQVFTIKQTTNSKSYVFTPGDLAELQELVMVGNSVIKK
jgi:hypothetical protein